MIWIFAYLLSQEHYHVRDLKTGKILLSLNEKNSVSIFSISKIFLAYLCLKHLNAEETFQTKVFYDGVLEKKILKGNLYLEGGGDPYLGANEILKIVLKVKSKIQIIEGKILLKKSNFPKVITLSEEFPIEDPYNTSLSFLNFEWNRFKSSINSSYYSFDFFPEEKISVEKKSSGEEWKGLSLKKEIPLKYPEKFVQSYFEHLLTSFIQVKKRTIEKTKLEVLEVEKSLDLKIMIKNLLEYSNNLIAEALAAKLIHKLEPQEKKNLILKKKLQQRLQQESSSFKVEHASGLSSKNKIILSSLTSWLQEKAFDSFHGEFFMNILPKKESAFDAYKVFAKSGTGHFSISLAGYLLTKKHHWIVFAHSVFDENKRILLSSNPYNEKLIKQAHVFQKEAKKKQEEFLKNLYENY